MLGVLGRGGFGTVYRADLLGDGAFVRPVALKVLNPVMATVATVAERLRDEARILGRIRHRSIVQVDGLIRLEDRWTIVMEYVDGVDLGRVVDAGPMPARAALELIGEVAGALHVAYTWPGDDGPLGLLHRDLKPQNLLLTAAGEAKIVDFGVARVDLPTREAVTRGMRFGSPGYSAPERADGEERPEGDVYSLGVVAYELLAGDRLGRPSVRRDRAEPFVADALARLSDRVEPGVTTFLAELLAYEPGRRPSAREVERRCRALVASLDGPFLRDWAEHAVPPLLAARTLDPVETGAFSGEIVSERLSGPSPPDRGTPPPALAAQAPAAPVLASSPPSPPVLAATPSRSAGQVLVAPPPRQALVAPPPRQALVAPPPVAHPPRPAAPPLRPSRGLFGALADLSVFGAVVVVAVTGVLGLLSTGCLFVICFGGGG
ncbi:MAG: serine/threonine-protein kinase [Myxococcota bacterium]